MTRIIDENTIQQGQKDLIGRLLGAINMDALRSALYGLPAKLDPIWEIQPTGNGCLQPLHDRVAYQLELKVSIPVTILVDAEGNYLPMNPNSGGMEESARDAAAAMEGCTQG